MKRLLVSAGVAAAWLVLAASPADAHASLVSTDPPANAALDSPPPAIVLRFTEPVEDNGATLTLLDADANEIPVVGPERLDDGAALRYTLEGPTDTAYVASWRAVSTDGHPIAGSFTFTVGNATPVTPDELGSLTADRGDAAVGWLYGIARWATFAAIALLVGGAALLATLAHVRRTRPAASLLLVGAAIGLVIASLAEILLQGPYLRGFGLADVFDAQLLADNLETRVGRATATRLVLALFALPIVAVLTRGSRLPGWWRPTAALWTVALVLASAVGGHASTGRWSSLAIPVDAVHQIAMAIWVGGLATLAVVVLRGEEHADDERRVVVGFSTVAATCVVTLVATGAFQSLRQVEALGTLWTTDFGRLLLLKLGVVAIMVAAASASRTITRREIAVGTVAADTRARLRSGVAVEAAFGAVVLAVTAALVAAPPARVATGSEPEPFVESVTSDEYRFDVQIAPGSVGANTMHLTLFGPSGARQEALEMSADVELPAGGIAPIEVSLTQLAPGHYTASSLSFPLAGDWTLTLTALISELDQVTAETIVPIR